MKPFLQIALVLFLVGFSQNVNADGKKNTDSKALIKKQIRPFTMHHADKKANIKALTKDRTNPKSTKSIYSWQASEFSMLLAGFPREIAANSKIKDAPPKGKNDLLHWQRRPFLMIKKEFSFNEETSDFIIND